MDRRDFIKVGGWGAVGAAWARSAAAASTRPDSASEPEGDPRFREMLQLIEAKMAQYAVPGVAFALSKGEFLASRGLGLTNLDNPQPVTRDTVFPIASISKTITATAIMRLRDRGLVDVEAPVTEYIPGFRIADDSATQDVRIWHLLTHTPGWEGQLGPRERGEETLSTFIGSMREVPALAAPGEVWGYNNAGWGVAGGVIEVATRSPISEALEDLVFRPLGLDRAFSRTGDAMTYRFAAGHRQADDQVTVEHAFQLPTNVPAGGCAMSVENLIRYARFHLGDGTAASGERLLSQASLRAMRTPRVRKNSSTDEMGLGWHLRTLGGVTTAQHGGALSGHSLHLQLVPERDLCFAILSNSGGTEGGGWRLNEDVATAILRDYEDLALAPDQQTGGNRGGNERMHLHARPLETQPPLDEFLGVYARPPYGDVRVELRDARLGVTSGEAQFRLLFYASEMAYCSTSGPGCYEGMPVEFLRDPSGRVGWIRVDGRIARKV